MYLNYLVEKKRKELAEKRPSSGVSALGTILRWKRPALPVPALPRPAPRAPAPPAAYSHILNDPTTPDLVESVTTLPAQPAHNVYVVQGLKAGGFSQGTLEFQAANAYITIGETLNLVNSYAGDRKIPFWPRTRSLSVFPRAGVDLNAYYDGRSLRFFYASDTRIGGSVFTVDSADIVSHECGHGVLDCYRPDLWSAAFLEVGAFHECFGDFIAIMHSLSHDKILQRVITETNGDIALPNVASRMAEQFGRAIYRLNPSGRSPDYLRSAINNFKYVNPSSLPEDAPDNQLASEVHNFSRIFTGAIWDILVMIYNDLKTTMSQIDALKLARDWVCKYVIKAIQNAPLNSKFFESVAKTIVWADITLNNGKYRDRIQAIFVDRQIISLQVMALSSSKCPNRHHIVKNSNMMKLKLQDVVVSAQSGRNPLYGVELTVPQDEVYLYDKKGRMMDVISSTTEDTIQAAQDLVHYLYATQSYGPDQTTPWAVENGKLIRTRTCCCFRR